MSGKALTLLMPGRVAQSVARLTQEPELLGSIPGPDTYFCSSSADSKAEIVVFWRLGGLSLPWNSVDRLTDHLYMTIAIYREREATKEQKNNDNNNDPLDFSLLNLFA